MNDYNGNVTQETDSDWGGGTLRTISQVFMASTGTANSGRAADSGSAYWNPSSPAITSLVACRSVTGSSNGSVSQFGYDPAGNRTAEFDWDSTKPGAQPNCSTQLTTASSVETIRGCDGYGNLSAVQNGNGYVTTINAAANLGSVVRTDPLNRSTTTTLDTNTGLPLSAATTPT